MADSYPRICSNYGNIYKGERSATSLTFTAKPATLHHDWLKELFWQLIKWLHGV